MLDTGGRVRLSGFGQLDHNVFERLLELLGRALASSPTSSGTRRSATTDGKIEIVLRQPDDGDDAHLTTPRGRFSGLTADHEWCTYPELIGVAIHQLITSNDGDDAVTTARFVWDGRDLLPDA